MSSTLAKITIALTLLVALFVHHSDAIHCWQCNSASNDFCNQVPSGPVSNGTKIASCLQDLYKECSTEGGLNYTFCRVQEQTIKGEKRVIRGCGYDKADVDCYMTKTPSVSTKVCQCFTDGCNGSNSVTLGLVTIVAALLINRLIAY